jgi:hypothetical protein
MKFDKKSPCSECPFRKTSIRGWLGPDDEKQVLSKVHGEGGYPCHMDLTKAPVITKGPNAGYLDTSDTQQCAGAIIHANLSHKCYRDPELRAHQDRLEGCAHEKDVLNLREFLEHHKSAIPQDKLIEDMDRQQRESVSKLVSKMKTTKKRKKVSNG